MDELRQGINMKRLIFGLLFLPTLGLAQTAHETVHNNTHNFKQGIRVDAIYESTTGAGVSIGTAGASQVYTNSDNGTASLSSNCVTDDTDSGAGTHVVVAVFPAGALRLGLTLRVDTILAGASLAAVTVGDGTDPDLYDDGLALAAGSTSDSSTYTASPVGFSATALGVTLTAGAGQFDSGTVTVCGFYLLTAAPAS